MARRIDIELTSTRPDGTWTWRAAGAKEPKGVLDGTLLYAGAKPGDVLKAEAEFEIEGITIVSVAAPKDDGRREADRLEVIGPSHQETPGVTTQLVGRSDRRGPSRRHEGEQRPRPDRARDAGRGPDRRHLPGSDRPERPARQSSTAGERRERPERPRRPTRAEGAPEGTTGEQRHGEERPRRAPRERSARPAEREAPSRAESRGKRLNPGHAHRQAILESLAPEERAVAEQVLRGGVPAVRTALHLEREKAAAEGRPAPNTDQLVAMAEGLLPRLKTAEWHDRAEAAAKTSDEISLRDLRSVVASADVARDEETRALAATLRETLERRVESLRSHWSDEVEKHLDEGRVVRALRLSSRPPEPSARLSDDLAKRLGEAAGESMSPAAAPDLWLALLDAAATSPVRRSIHPAGLPSEPSAEVKQAALQQSGRIPALAAMLGMAIPPPPAPVGRRPPPPPRRTPPAKADPPPTAPPTAAESPASAASPASAEPPTSAEPAATAESTDADTAADHDQQTGV